MTLCYEIADEAAMLAFGAALAGRCEPGTTIFLEGELGAGKTTWVRGFLQGLGYQGRVKSPTYTLVEPYELAGRDIYHFDLYRLSDPEELEYIGGRDYFDAQATCLVEWPERGAGLLPQPDVRLVIHYKEQGREVVLQGLTAAGQQLETQFKPDDAL